MRMLAFPVRGVQGSRLSGSHLEVRMRIGWQVILRDGKGQKKRTLRAPLLQTLVQLHVSGSRFVLIIAY